MGLSNLFARGLLATALLTAIAGCASRGVNLGFSLPMGRSAGVGVSVGSDGRVGTSVGVGVGSGSLSVGTSGQLGQWPGPTRAQREKKNADQ